MVYRRDFRYSGYSSDLLSELQSIGEYLRPEAVFKIDINSHDLYLQRWTGQVYLYPQNQPFCHIEVSLYGWQIKY